MALTSELTDQVLHLTLNRPERYNAIDVELRDALLGALRGAPEQGARAIVLRGAGKGFCAGVDLKSDNMTARGHGTERLMSVSSHVLLRAVVDCPLPIVAGIHGTVAGMGLVLALGADVCIATEDARFGVTFIHRALVPDAAIARLLPRIIGYSRAREIILRGRTIEAAEAHRLGITSHLVPATELDAAVRDVAVELAQLPTVAIGYAKRLLLRGYETDLDTFLLEERAYQGLASTTIDYDEGINAFLDKRQPRFQGR
ncbi:MAG: enoyl-CoA hydratase-related protein [Acidimicrobiia bacterium]|nr:enoyl-CoA hydratase-related protein [Acidimicrobiia bacterium]